MCPIPTALEERRESAYGYKQTSRGLRQRVRFTPNTGHRKRDVRFWPDYVCSSPRSGRFHGLRWTSAYDPKRSWGLATAAGRRIGGLGQFPRMRLGLANAMLPMIGAHLEPGSCGRLISIIEDDSSKGDRGRTRSGKLERFGISDPPCALVQAAWLAIDSVSRAWIALAPSVPRSFSQIVRSRSRLDTRASALR